jgi:hypothetical protein
MVASSAPPVATLAGLHRRMAQVKTLTTVSHITTLDDFANCAPATPCGHSTRPSLAPPGPTRPAWEVLLVIIGPYPQSAARITGCNVRSQRQDFVAGHGCSVTAHTKPVDGDDPVGPTKDKQQLPLPPPLPLPLPMWVPLILSCRISRTT